MPTVTSKRLISPWVVFRQRLRLVRALRALWVTIITITITISATRLELVKAWQVPLPYDRCSSSWLVQDKEAKAAAATSSNQHSRPPWNGGPRVSVGFLDGGDSCSRRGVLQKSWQVLSFHGVVFAGSVLSLITGSPEDATAAGAPGHSSSPDLITCSISSSTTSSSSASSSGLSRRLEDSILQQPQPTVVPDELNGVDNFFYPSYLAGTWNVTQTLVNVSMPLGLIYLGGPNGDRAIAEKALTESQSRLNVPVQLQLRYIPTTHWGVAEDRLFNTRQRLNAFAGRTVVSTVDYADVGASNRVKILALGGTDKDPLQTTFVRYKGPAAQKTFVTAHSSSVDDLDDSNFGTCTRSWMGSESQRSIFALTNENTAPPIFTDTETIYQFTPAALANNTDKDGNAVVVAVHGRLRIASYLNAQQDKLYFQARNRAVSLLDYKLEMVRVA